jgi:GNAT superfamily N-acetyltransferase
LNFIFSDITYYPKQQMQVDIRTVALGTTPPQLSHTAWDGEVFTSNVKTDSAYFADLGAMFTATKRGGAYAFVGNKAIGASEFEDYIQYRERILNAKPTSAAVELHELHKRAVAVIDQYAANHDAKPANGCGVAIEPEYRKNNLASQLCERRLACAKEAGYTHLFVETTGYSCKLMRAHGFKELAAHAYSFPCEWKFMVWVKEL